MRATCVVPGAVRGGVRTLPVVPGCNYSEVGPDARTTLANLELGSWSASGRARSRHLDHGDECSSLLEAAAALACRWRAAAMGCDAVDGRLAIECPCRPYSI